MLCNFWRCYISPQSTKRRTHIFARAAETPPICFSIAILISESNYLHVLDHMRKWSFIERSVTFAATGTKIYNPSIRVPSDEIEAVVTRFEYIAIRFPVWVRQV